MKITSEDLDKFDIDDMLLDDDGACGDPDCCGPAEYYINKHALVDLINKVIEDKE